MTQTEFGPKRAALYLRQSKADDEGIERQQQRATALADARGWKIEHVFIDNDVSASKARSDQTAWGRLLAASDAIDVVVSVDLDRIVRSTRDLNTLIEHRLALVTVDGEIDLASADGELRASVLASVARFEVRRKAERQRRASDQRAAKGRPTARPGYGYRRVDGRDVVVPEHAAVIREAARRVLDGESMRSVSADLNRRGVPSPRTVERARISADDAGLAPISWQGVTLRQMLRRPSLAGLRTHRGVVVGAFDPEWHPAILDADTHDRLIALFDDPTRASSSRVGHPPRHLLSGIAWCGRCGETLGGRMMRLAGWTPKPGQGSKPTKPAYACRACMKVRRLQEPVDVLVTEALLRRLEREDAADLFTTGDPATARELRAQIEAVTARLATAADLFAAGTIDGDQLARITAGGRAEREQLEAGLSAALPPALPSDAVGPGVRAAWERYDVERRRLILSTVARVTIMPSRPGRSFDPELIRIEWLTDSPAV
jgi:DNA invertase Pin-like site-specific DNA recombinase